MKQILAGLLLCGTVSTAHAQGIQNLTGEVRLGYTYFSDGAFSIRSPRLEFGTRFDIDRFRFDISLDGFEYLDSNFRLISADIFTSYSIDDEWRLGAFVQHVGGRGLTGSTHLGLSVGRETEGLSYSVRAGALFLNHSGPPSGRNTGWEIGMSVDADIAQNTRIAGRLGFADDGNERLVLIGAGLEHEFNQSLTVQAYARHFAIRGGNENWTDGSLGLSYRFDQSHSFPLTVNAEIGELNVSRPIWSARAGLASRINLGSHVVDISASATHFRQSGLSANRFELAVAVPFGQQGRANTAYRSYFDDFKSSRTYLDNLRDIVGPRGTTLGLF